MQFQRTGCNFGTNLNALTLVCKHKVRREHTANVAALGRAPGAAQVLPTRLHSLFTCETHTLWRTARHPARGPDPGFPACGPYPGSLRAAVPGSARAPRRSVAGRALECPRGRPLDVGVRVRRRGPCYPVVSVGASVGGISDTPRTRYNEPHCTCCPGTATAVAASNPGSAPCAHPDLSAQTPGVSSFLPFLCSEGVGVKDGSGTEPAPPPSPLQTHHERGRSTPSCHLSNEPSARLGGRPHPGDVPALGRGPTSEEVRRVHAGSSDQDTCAALSPRRLLRTSRAGPVETPPAPCRRVQTRRSPALGGELRHRTPV